ncbi:hypothetical protein GV64_11555 [Endozoicomonas elysicola]|uniref:Uncharacterized protein n=2 Tax=Endozoicomonas elysicola TaxID=305900 RepID=A0A081KAW3_9GAMM|nr:hypothetical protein GV64_11555 [Endozoicomonas elysicola]
MMILVDFIAFKYWQRYLSSGAIHDGKHGLTFLGEATVGHLVGATTGAILLTYYVIKVLFNDNYKQ